MVVQETARAQGRELVHTTEQEASRFLAERLDDIDTVIIDLSSGQSAVDLLRTITGLETNPPVIVLAGAEQLGAVPVARKCGASACIRKPLTAEKLISVMEQLYSAGSNEQSWTSDVWGHPHRKLICTRD